MLSFTGSLSPDIDAFAIFVSDKYHYNGKSDILSKDSIKKITSYLGALKTKKTEEGISSFDISDKQKCFVIKVKDKYKNYFPQEVGANFFSYLKNFKDVKKITFCSDTLDLDKEKLTTFFSQFIFGFNLKSYTFNKYKTLDKAKINKVVNYNIIT